MLAIVPLSLPPPGAQLGAMGTGLAGNPVDQVLATSSPSSSWGPKRGFQVGRLWFIFSPRDGQSVGTSMRVSGLMQHTSPAALHACSGPWIPLLGLFLWVPLGPH